MESPKSVPKNFGDPLIDHRTIVLGAIHSTVHILFVVQRETGFWLMHARNTVVCGFSGIGSRGILESLQTR